MVLVKSVEIDIGVKGDRESKAKLDDISARAESLKKAFPEYKLKIDSAAAAERLKVFRAQLAEATRDRTANVKVKVDDSALAKFAAKMQGGGPGLLVGGALALAPAAGVLGGVAAGAAAGLAGAFAAGAGALAAFGAVAKPVLTDAKTAATAVETAQNAHALAVEKVTAQYQIAMTTAKTQAQRNAAYATEQKGFQNAALTQQLAVNKAYANLSPAQIALSKQLGAMADAWDKVKAAQTPVVAGALQPWLKSVTDLTKQLGPIVKAVAPVIGSLGSQFESIVSSSAFTKFRDFIASTGSRVVGGAGNAVLGLVQAFIILLPKFNPLIQGAATWLGNLGPAIEKWASSKKTADQITAFMKWFHDNGPVVVGLLKNVGGALKAMAPGLTAGGALELQALSGFLGLVAKLPPSVAKPLFEVAGALLLLNKLGVVKVGVKLVGLGGKAGGAAAGAAGAEGAAGGAGAKGIAGAVAGASLTTVVGVAAVAGAVIGEAISKITTGKFESLAQWKTKWVANLKDAVSSTETAWRNITHWFDTGRHWIAATTQQTGKDIANWWNITWNNTITRTAKGFHDVAVWFDTGRHWIAARTDQIRATTPPRRWDAIWNNTGRPGRAAASAIRHDLDRGAPRPDHRRVQGRPGRGWSRRGGGSSPGCGRASREHLVDGGGLVQGAPRPDPEGPPHRVAPGVGDRRGQAHHGRDRSSGTRSQRRDVKGLWASPAVTAAEGVWKTITGASGRAAGSPG